MFRKNGFERITGFLMSVALATGLGCSKDEAVDPNAGIREIYYLSDLQGQVQPISIYAEQTLDQQTTLFTPEQREIARQVIQRELSAKKIEQAVLERLADQPQREHLDAAREWLKTPAVEKFMQSKVIAWTPAGLQEMKVFVESQQGKPVNERREALIERYDKATKSSDREAETMLLAAYGVAVMHDVLQPIDQRTGPEELRQAMTTQRGVLKPIFKETSAVAARFAFRDQSDDEVEAFVGFLESPAGQWLSNTTQSTFLNGLLGTTANLGSIYFAALPGQAAAQ
jgi:hypothetical protein